MYQLAKPYCPVVKYVIPLGGDDRRGNVANERHVGRTERVKKDLTTIDRYSLLGKQTMRPWNHSSITNVRAI